MKLSQSMSDSRLLDSMSDSHTAVRLMPPAVKPNWVKIAEAKLVGVAQLVSLAIESMVRVNSADQRSASEEIRLHQSPSGMHTPNKSSSECESSWVNRSFLCLGEHGAKMDSLPMSFQILNTRKTW